ncbi:MAG: hypothetical protein HZB16_01350 [Armatimonadetes bacterium]|nr:hypothetical protein [Armatimonadota bacterium]
MSDRVPAWVPWMCLVAVLLQSHLAYRMGWAGEFCDLSLAVALSCALAAGEETGILAGLVVGLLMGYSAGLALPAFIVSRVVAAGAVGRMRFVVHAGNPLAQVGVVALGAVGAEVLFALFYPAVLGQPGWFERVLFRAGLTAIVTLPVAWLLSWLPLPEERMA